jgi:hypothetical protein
MNPYPSNGNMNNQTNMRANMFLNQPQTNLSQKTINPKILPNVINLNDFEI